MWRGASQATKWGVFVACEWGGSSYSYEEFVGYDGSPPLRTHPPFGGNENANRYERHGFRRAGGTNCSLFRVLTNGEVRFCGPLHFRTIPAETNLCPARCCLGAHRSRTALRGKCRSEQARKMMAVIIENDRVGRPLRAQSRQLRLRPEQAGTGIRSESQNPNFHDFCIFSCVSTHAGIHFQNRRKFKFTSILKGRHLLSLQLPSEMDVGHRKYHYSESGHFRMGAKSGAKNSQPDKFSVTNPKIFAHQTSSVVLSLDTHRSYCESISGRGPLSAALPMACGRRR